ncbi:hypothetical protein Q4511_05355 [Paracoccus sp. 1_MG-2023]|uniref:hypothetical protein n=1 Tax=unclassified Paracoccus (in: a-proteobacteria) TaxID=2688777 RepID=UPI001C08B94C|nr:MULTISPECIES: hypothetical protein [unclassified Paracoccus (in: a-proteobacteria)]MBU2958216.1 hypothetical protein [Paracoccus sp. C2R09]MDO6668343.1 hypothetical protein [Paracoccus sp. 1_MG-2023]
MNATDCTRKCWITAAIIGLLVWIFTSGIGSMRWFEGLFLGLVALGLMGAFLDWLICRGHPAQDAAEWHPKEHLTTYEEDLALSPRGIASDAMVGMLGAAEGQHRVTPSGDAAPQAPATAKAADRNDIYAAQSGAEDDLKLIKGVGPKLEDLLHEHGVNRFAQIAQWDDAEIDRFAEIIGRMGGRIRSDDWVGQAQMLARGGETEFSKRAREGSGQA